METFTHLTGRTQPARHAHINQYGRYHFDPEMQLGGEELIPELHI
jgi:hypothetical protein